MHMCGMEAAVSRVGHDTYCSNEVSGSDSFEWVRETLPSLPPPLTLDEAAHALDLP